MAMFQKVFIKVSNSFTDKRITEYEKFHRHNHLPNCKEVMVTIATMNMKEKSCKYIIYKYYIILYIDNIKYIPSMLINWIVITCHNSLVVFPILLVFFPMNFNKTYNNIGNVFTLL